MRLTKTNCVGQWEDSQVSSPDDQCHHATCWCPAVSVWKRSWVGVQHCESPLVRWVFWTYGPDDQTSQEMFGRAKLTYDELVTEVKAVINSRPLSYISSDDMDEPLTSAHLLVERRLLSLPDGLITDTHKPRGFWRLACVKSLICGSDGHSRGAVLTTSPSEKRFTLRWPLQRLYPLEVRSISSDCSENEAELDGPS